MSTHIPFSVSVPSAGTATRCRALALLVTCALSGWAVAAVAEPPPDGHAREEMESRAGTVSARFRIPADVPAQPLWWSAEPLDPGMNPEAWAPISELIEAQGEFEPGRYKVTATAPDGTEFGAIITIVQGEANDFVIPIDVGADRDTAGFDTVPALSCTGQVDGCPFIDADTGLSLIVPDGWSVTPPFRYETAGGATAHEATATLFRHHRGELQTIELNPRQWLASLGPCVEWGVHTVCHAHPDSIGVAQAMATLEASPAFRPAR